MAESIKVAITSDWHGYLLPEEMIPDVDLMIIAGDLGLSENFSYGPEILLTDRFNFLESLPFPVIAIAGNHDFEKEVKIMRHMPWVYLEDEAVDFRCPKGGSIKIWGSPWSNPFGYGWAYNMPEKDQKELFQQIPEDTHVIISHGPPFGSGDLIPDSHYGPAEHVGSAALLDRMFELPNLQLVATGHIHVAYGTYDVPGMSATVINGSLVNEDYQIINEPIIVEISL